MTEICAHCVLPDSYPRITFDKEGVCSVCRRYEKRWEGWKSLLPERHKVLRKICKQAHSKHREFDALIPLSGGKDSMYVLYTAKQELGLNCIASTLNHGYLSTHARNNINRACRKLGVEHIYYDVDPNLINRLFALFMRKTGYFCSVCHRAIEMTNYRVADMYKVPIILSGTSLRTELPLSAEMFQYGSIPYIRGVLRGEPIAPECKRLFYGRSVRRNIGLLLFLLSGRRSLVSSASLNLADYMEWNYETILQVIHDELGWRSAADRFEHMDCAIVPVAEYLHNRRFPGLSQRRLTLARHVMAGQTSRDEALRILNEEAEEQCPESLLRMFLRNLDMSREEFDHFIDMGPRHLQFRPQPNPLTKAALSRFRVEEAGME